jgi:hypothetical protein
MVCLNCQFLAKEMKSNSLPPDYFRYKLLSDVKLIEPPINQWKPSIFTIKEYKFEIKQQRE